MYFDCCSQLQALSDPIRMCLCMLMLEHDGNLSVAELVERTNARMHRTLTQPTISHHIRLLLMAGLVASERHGLYTYYQFNHTAYEQALNALQALLPVRERAIAVA